ncbi:uncharacterized protein LOC116164739 [Photinus pyralis]|uniref:uncharacterized protein LOC116164739 n=1 Tax=Photinus pyralis TaxID=7054 RepID=UPI0012670178|nr:uncharacterized protein LOC116164739 [Photinus pyralis]
MYFKLVLASVGLMCVDVASGFFSYNCYSCHGMYDNSPQEVDNCRKFVNISATSSCTRPGYCIFYYGEVTINHKPVVKTGRMCATEQCAAMKGWTAKSIHCSDCKGDYCNTDKYDK